MSLISFLLGVAYGKKKVNGNDKKVFKITDIASFLLNIFAGFFTLTLFILGEPLLGVIIGVLFIVLLVFKRKAKSENKN